MEYYALLISLLVTFIFSFRLVLVLKASVIVFVPVVIGQKLVRYIL